MIQRMEVSFVQMGNFDGITLKEIKSKHNNFINKDRI